MKSFLKKLLPFVLFILLLELAIPMLVDPYNIFHWSQLRDNGVEPNSNYIKTQYVLHNPERFDSFLFGSSRTGFIDVEKIDDGGSWYNMSYSEGLPAEHLDTLRTFLENGIVPKTVMIGLDDISCFVDPSQHANQFYRIPYPRTNPLGFYAKYLSIKGVIASLDVILSYEPTDADYAARYYRSGSTVKDPTLGGEWEGDSPYWEDYYSDHIGTMLAYLDEIINLCEENDIRLILFTNPTYKSTYEHAVYYGYRGFLEYLTNHVDGYYNFSGVNDITADKTNYYEASHYTEAVGDLIIQTIFEEKNDDTLKSQGFGMYVTKDNLEEFKEALETH